MSIPRPFERHTKVSEKGFDDPLVELNQAQNGSNATDVGLVLNRGSNPDVAIYWNELNSSFRVAYVGSTPPYGSRPNQLQVETNASLTSGSQFVSTGNFNVDGDAKAGTYTLRNQTQNSTPTELFIDGSTVRLIVADNAVWTYEILITGKRIDAGQEAASIKIVGAISRNTGASSIFMVGNPSRTIMGRTDPLWTAAVAADTVHGSLQVLVTGAAGKVIQWVARVTTTEIIYG